MSERTNYFAIKTDDPDLVRQKLQENQIPAILYVIPRTARSNWQALPPHRRWLVAVCPPPWTYEAADIATNVIEIMHQELSGDWSFRIINRGQHLKGSFHGRFEHLTGMHVTVEVTQFSPEEQQFLSDFFGVSFGVLKSVFEPGMAQAFCDTVGVPFLEGIDQNLYEEGTSEYSYLLENGYAVYAEDIFD